ncbi:SDR family NAD(P)-dependent oxidoreductase, partial [Mariniblastus sp.]|nr:SDR family NAD(P)-dependent oxidoreductase [Mariniblastus sp.]
MRNIDLTGKTAIVTGGGQGIGLATATSLFEAGANVILNYFPDADGNNEKIAQSACDSLGDRCLALPADVRDPEQLANMCSE